MSIICLNTKFSESGDRQNIYLISIALVSNKGKEYYAISNEFNAKFVSPWVRENVLSKLPERPENLLQPPDESPRRREEARLWKSRATIRKEILDFVASDEDGSKLEFWGEYPAHSWVAFCWLFGCTIDLPKGYPYKCNDVIQWADQMGLDKSFLPPKQKNSHHALTDARWVKQAYYLLKELSDNIYSGRSN